MMPRKPLSACAIALLLLGGCAQSSTLTPSLSAGTAGTPVSTASLSKYPARPIPFTVYDLFSTWHRKAEKDSKGSVYLVDGPYYPPLGKGSVEFHVDDEGHLESVVTAVYDGIPLASINALCYSTFVKKPLGQLAPFLSMRVDLNGDGTTDEVLTFEPIYQTGTYENRFGPPNEIPHQGLPGDNPVAVGQWQKWNALAGGWWNSGGGPPLQTIHDYVAHHPYARLAHEPISADYKGAFSIATGFGWPPGGFVGNADALKFGTTAKWPPTILWDFEK